MKADIIRVHTASFYMSSQLVPAAEQGLSTPLSSDLGALIGFLFLSLNLFYSTYAVWAAFTMLAQNLLAYSKTNEH